MKSGRLLTTAIALLALVALPGTAHAAPLITIIEAYGSGPAWVKFSYTCDPGSATTATVLVTAGRAVANSHPRVTCDSVSHTTISGTSCLTSCNFLPGTFARVTLGLAGASDAKDLVLRPRPW